MIGQKETEIKFYTHMYIIAGITKKTRFSVGFQN